MTSEDIEALAKVAFNAYATRMASATTLRMKTQIADWDEQHAEVRASWCVSTSALVNAYEARVAEALGGGVRSCDFCGASLKTAVALKATTDGKRECLNGEACDARVLARTAARMLVDSKQPELERGAELLDSGVGPEDFPGTDEESHYTAQTSAKKIREDEEMCCCDERSVDPNRTPPCPVHG
jgi:hypothetical protein